MHSSDPCLADTPLAGVTLHGVSKVHRDKVHGDRVALAPMDLQVRQGELLVLLGPSGSGKTTTLRLIAGLESPTTGQIAIGGRAMAAIPPRDRNVAMVFQNHALYPHWTVYRNLAIGLELRSRGWLRRAWAQWTSPGKAAHASPPESIASQVQRTARELRIEHLLRRLPGELSGGERQRVALGKALVRRPDLFLLDEPLSNLDAQLRDETRRELKLLHQRLGSTMIYVTHDQVEALTLGDRIVVLDRGLVQQVGAPWEVYHRPANRFVAGFIGSPAMNLFQGTLDHAAGGRLRFQGSGWSFAWDAGDISQKGGRQGPPPMGSSPVVLGVRPQDVQVQSARADVGQAAGAGLWTPGRLTLSEQLGDCVVVHIAPQDRVLADRVPAEPGAGGQPDGQGRQPQPDLLLRCKMDAPCALKPGDSVLLRVDLGRAHWFDGPTGLYLHA